jgi:hypothetical protein
VSREKLKLEDKMKSRKFVGYVPKGEKIADTVRWSMHDGIFVKDFGMFSKKESTAMTGNYVKRTITITWEDKPVKR